MLRSYLQVALRAMQRNKLNSFITIVGLGVGIACCLLISLYVKEEWSFDRFHSKSDRIYRVWAQEDWGENQQFSYSNTPYAMGPTLKENFEEIANEVRFDNLGSMVRVHDQQFADPVTIVGKDFFDVFDFEFTRTKGRNVFGSPQNIVITERMAKKYFGDADPLNEVIGIQLGDEFEDFTVAAVVRNPPTNSSLQFEMLISDANYSKFVSQRALTSAWFNISPETYLLLREGTTAADIEGKFPTLFKTLLGDDYAKSKYTVMLQPLEEIHLDTTVPAGIAQVSDPKYSYILAATSVLILLLACINFVTISIGRSLKRSREVGIRKVVGAAKQQLVFQFVGEAVLITVIALILGTILAAVFLPVFNDLAQKQLTIELNLFMLLVSLGLIAIIGLLAGSYPAFVLSNLNVQSIFKGRVSGLNSRHTLRRALVAIQLALSVLLVSSTLIMRKQLEFLQNKNLGFDREQLAVVQLNVSRGDGFIDRIGRGFELAQLFKNELNNISSVIGVCGSSHDFANGDWVNIGYTDDTNIYRTFNVNFVDADYFDVLKLTIEQGRGFDKKSQRDRSRGLVVNQAFVKEMGWENPIGKRLPGARFPDHEVIGVVKDFNYSSLYTRVEPLVIAMDPNLIAPGIENINVDNSPIPKLIIRLQPGNIALAIDQIHAVWDKLVSGEEFSFSFVDQAIQKQYSSDQNLGRIIGIATLLAILLGSLGLYGLASLSMQNRVKEISIRKVFGAPTRSLLVLLTREYVYMVVIALVLSIPFTIYLMTEWLKNFEYRVSLGVSNFLAAGGILLTITLITVLYQTLVTASSRPAETLRNE